MQKKTIYILLSIILFSPFFIIAQNTYQIGILKYNGGGDWYANPTSLPNLIKFTNKNIHTNIKPEIATVEVGSQEIFNYPFLHMTGHGNITLTKSEAENLRNYLIAGGFIHIDDNYGMDPYVRLAIKQIFPDYKLDPLSNKHPIFHQKYDFPNGLPKIHEHDQQLPQAFGIIIEGELVLLYTHE